MKSNQVIIPTESLQSKGLRELDAMDAMKLAVELSGMSIEEIAQAMNMNTSNVRRWFSTDKYYPSYVNLPKLCRLLGNMTLINWLQVQAMNGDEPAAHNLDCAMLVSRVGELFGEMGEVGIEAQRAVEDGKLEALELRRIIREVTDVVTKGNRLVADLRVAERRLAAAEKEEQEEADNA